MFRPAYRALITVGVVVIAGAGAVPAQTYGEPFEAQQQGDPPAEQTTPRPGCQTRLPVHDTVRTTNSALERLITEGYRRSATFRRVVDALVHTSTRVYVESNWSQQGQGLARNLSGGLQFITSSGGTRFLQVSIRQGATDDEVMATLAHELQHALEVGQAPHVTDGESFRRLFQVIGERRCFGLERECYDTAAAIDVGHDVLAEVRRASADDACQRELQAE